LRQSAMNLSSFRAGITTLIIAIILAYLTFWHRLH
jgi:hypothetical protein